MATDVAARGLDMIVDLVLNAEPPSHQSGRVDTESYVHRSGRTGRAGRKGMCITLYTPRQRGGLGEIGEAWMRRGGGCPVRLAIVFVLGAVSISTVPFDFATPRRLSCEAWFFCS